VGGLYQSFPPESSGLRPGSQPRVCLFPEAGQYQKRSGQPLLARIEQLIDQVRLSAADRPLSILTLPVVEAFAEIKKFYKPKHC